MPAFIISEKPASQIPHNFSPLVQGSLWNSYEITILSGKNTHPKSPTPCNMSLLYSDTVSDVTFSSRQSITLLQICPCPLLTHIQAPSPPSCHRCQLTAPNSICPLHFTHAQKPLESCHERLSDCFKKDIFFNYY